MDHPDGLPKWPTLKWTKRAKISFRISTIENTAIYILTMCCIHLCLELHNFMEIFTLLTLCIHRQNFCIVWKEIKPVRPSSLFSWANAINFYTSSSLSSSSFIYLFNQKFIFLKQYKLTKARGLRKPLGLWGRQPH